MIDVSAIVAYENGELSTRDTLRLFSQLIKDGTVWQLQGHYGRFATSLMENHIIDTDGQIDWPLVDTLMGVDDDAD